MVDDVRNWLSGGEGRERVVAVHCKGGKGRTGTMICVWLIESGVFSSAALSLDYFGNRRPDTNVSKKFQGVETPSQSRSHISSSYTETGDKSMFHLFCLSGMWGTTSG